MNFYANCGIGLPNGIVFFRRAEAAPKNRTFRSIKLIIVSFNCRPSLHYIPPLPSPVSVFPAAESAAFPIELPVAAVKPLAPEFLSGVIPLPYAIIADIPAAIKPFEASAVQSVSFPSYSLVCRPLSVSAVSVLADREFPVTPAHCSTACQSRIFSEPVHIARNVRMAKQIFSDDNEQILDVL